MIKMKIEMMFKMEMQLKMKELLLVMKKVVKVLAPLIVIIDVFNKFYM